MNLVVLGIAGKAEVGKDYVAGLLGRGWTQFSLSWHFKIWSIALGKATWEEVFETKPPHVRKMLQLMGTEDGRDVFGENVWCDAVAAWVRTLAAHSKEELRFVVPDIRFSNEVDMIHRLGGKVLRIAAPMRAAKSKLTEEQRLHLSETALDNYTGFDGILHNDPSPVIDLDLQLIQHFRNFGWISDAKDDIT